MASANRVIGVDLGGTKIATGVVDREGAIHARAVRPTPTESEQALVGALEDAIGELLHGDIGAIGMGVPSTVDQKTGRAVSSVNIPLKDVPLRDLMKQRFDIPCGIDNDANAAAIGEWQVGAGKGTRDMVMLTLGTGVGGGLILNGRPYRGSAGAAAELGHMVIEHDGRPCQGTCTGRGHIEAYATGVAAGKDWGSDSRDLLAKAHDGDEGALELLRSIGHRLGSAIGTLVNIFDPEVVVIGGGFGEAADEFLLDPAREVMLREALLPARDRVRIVPAQLGGEAGLVGAGFVAFEALDSAEDW
ncbi:MAG TPA: ROK family protein [Gaiellaceae bacterium]|nr:ROK family protein [Gaiellaceae bacterium]